MVVNKALRKAYLLSCNFDRDIWNYREILEPRGPDVSLQAVTYLGMPISGRIIAGVIALLTSPYSNRLAVFSFIPCLSILTASCTSRMRDLQKFMRRFLELALSRYFTGWGLWGLSCRGSGEVEGPRG